MKKYILCMIIVVMGVVLVGCTMSSGVFFRSNMKFKEGKIEGSVTYFNGYKSKKIQLDKDQILEVDFKSETKKGEIVFLIIDSSGETLRELEPNMGIQQVSISESGKYTFKVKGQKYSGEIIIDYEVK